MDRLKYFFKNNDSKKINFQGFINRSSDKVDFTYNIKGNFKI